MSANLKKDLPWESSILGILYKQLFVHPKPLPTRPSLNGRTAVITGSNGGIGFEAARQLFQLGLSRLIMGVRSQASGDAAAEKLRAEFRGADIQVWLLDMADYGDIDAFARRCCDLDRIDYVILNAAMQSSIFKRHHKTGHELVFQVDYLSTALLCMLLASVLKDQSRVGAVTKPPVLTVVGSDTMYLSKFQAAGPISPRMDDPTGYDRMRQYMDSKLLLMVFVRQLARQVNPDDVVINVCNPGKRLQPRHGGRNWPRKKREAQPQFRRKACGPCICQGARTEGRIWRKRLCSCPLGRGPEKSWELHQRLDYQTLRGVDVY